MKGPVSSTYTLTTNTGLVVQSPGWSHVIDAIRRMNGDDLNIVSLDLHALGSLIIGGGNDGRFLVSYFPDNSGVPLILTDASLIGPDLPLTIQVDGEYPARWCVSLPLVLHVAQSLILQGIFPSDVAWEIGDTGVMFASLA